MATISIAMRRVGRPDGPETVQRTSKRSFVIGAAAGDSDIVIAGDAQVRAAHVRVIVRRDRALVLRPIAEARMVVNGVRFAIPMQVLEFDQIQIGGTLLRFDIDGDAGRRWWNPRDWGREEEAPLAPRSPTVPPGPSGLPTWPPIGNPPPPFDYVMLPRPTPPIPTMNPPMPPPRQPLPSRWRAELSTDPTEHALLAAIRDTPSDPAPRMVYADWLEAAARPVHAAAARGDRGPAITALTDEAWRAIVIHAPILECREPPDRCPGRWTALAAASPPDEACRACTACGKRVYFATQHSVLAMGQHGVPYAPDAGLDGPAFDLARAYARGRTTR